MGITGQSQAPAVEHVVVRREISLVIGIVHQRVKKKRGRYAEKCPTFFGKRPMFFGKRPMFLLNAWRSMNLTSEECFIVLHIFVFSTSLARARARTPYIFALFAFTTFTKMGVVY